MSHRAWFAAAAFAALGAGPLPAAAQAPDASQWQFRCPAAGTVVEQSTGTQLRYRDADPANPSTCRLSNGQSRFLGYWSVGEGFYRAGGTQIAQRVASGVAAAGTPTATFDYFTMNRTNEPIHVKETWRVAGSGPLTTPAGNFNTVRVERKFEIYGSTFTYTQTVWFDRATNVPVQARIEHLNAVQGPTLVNWVATDVRAPGPQAAAAGR